LQATKKKGKQEAVGIWIQMHPLRGFRSLCIKLRPADAQNRKKNGGSLGG